MKNITLSRLSLGSLDHSPLIANHRDVFKIEKSKFSNHFSTLFYSISPNVEFERTSFRNFLSVPIRIESVKRNEKTITNFTDFSFEDKIKITRCIFYQCNNKNMNVSGGALLINNFNTTVAITRTGFIYCKSSLYGGAIYAVCNDIDMTLTCFEENRALKGAQSFYVNSGNFHCYQVIISECGLKLNPLSRTTLVYNSSVVMDNTNISSNRFVTSENGISLVDCGTTAFKLNYLANNCGNGLLFISSIDDSSSFELCNLINNTGPDDLPMIYVFAKYLVFRKFVISDNSFNTYLEMVHVDKLSFVLCKFDCSMLKLGSSMQLNLKQCHFDLKDIKLNTINYPMQFRCYALGATDPPELVLPTMTPLPAPGLARPHPQPVPDYPEIPEYIPPPTFDWMPPGMVMKQYGLILFASIITPICIVIHCITTRGSRDIKALNELR